MTGAADWVWGAHAYLILYILCLPNVRTVSWTLLQEAKNVTIYCINKRIIKFKYHILRELTKKLIVWTIWYEY